jgi:hypothetical protein
LTGFVLGKILSSCSASSLGMPGISAGHQANILQCSRRNSMSALSYAGEREFDTYYVFLKDQFDFLVIQALCLYDRTHTNFRILDFLFSNSLHYRGYATCDHSDLKTKKNSTYLNGCFHYYYTCIKFI